MTTFSERQLGRSALLHIRKRLQAGKTFANRLLEALDLEEGIVITYLPDNVSDEGAHEFRHGGKLPPADESTWRRGPGVIFIPKENTDEWLTARIESFLSKSSERVCIFEEGIARASDPFWSKKDGKREFVAFVGDEVYYVVRSAETADQVSDAVNYASSAWPGSLGALTTADPDDPILINREIDPAQWPVLAARTEALIVGAYDAESYLIWSRQGSAAG